MNNTVVPPYMSLTETTRSPGESNANSALLMMPMPVEALVAASARSRMRTFSSKACTVGLVAAAVNMTGFLSQGDALPLVDIPVTE